jgi:thioredoxin-related protein
MIQPVPGYMKAKDFHQIITFFGGNYHKKEQFENYKTNIYSKLFSKKTI